MKHPLVSIITPAYNRASYLDETIRSVLNQDYQPIEYIVLDDGSTDNTREVLQKYTEQLIWETHPNMGETRTVNKGWGMARGDIIGVLSSDDTLLPGAVSAAVALLETYPDALVVYPPLNYIGPHSETLGHFQTEEYDYLRMLKKHRCVPMVGTFMRRKALDLAGMRDPEFRYVADYEYWLRLGLHGPFMRIPKTLANFRVHPDSTTVSGKSDRIAEEHIRMMRKFYSLPNLPPEVLQVRREAFSWAHYVAFCTSGRLHWNAFRHFMAFIYYYPMNFPIIYTALALRRILPESAYNRLRDRWRQLHSKSGGMRS